MRVLRATAFVTSALLAGTVVNQVPAIAAPAVKWQPLKPFRYPNVSASGTGHGAIKPADPTVAAAAATVKKATAGVVWPSAGSAVADLSSVTDPRVAQRSPARPGSLPVTLDQAATPGGGDLPRSVRVEMLDHASAVAAHQQVLLRVGRADGSTTAGRVSVRLDYSRFANAYGADYALRLRLVQLPACATTTPDAPGCQPVPVPSVNDTAGRVVSADITVPAASTAASPQTATPDATGATGAAVAAPAVMLALTSDPSGGAGDFTTPKLSPSSTWSAGGSSGDFTWSYPMRVPPSLGGPKPDVGLSYSAQSVDGHTAASNNQPSMIGEGFDYNPGSVTRSYKPCADDMGGTATNTTKTGDVCWSTYNASLSLNGHSGEIVRDDSSGGYRLKDDDGSRVELLTGASNGDNDGEYWRVTTTDGTQYYFGLNHLTGWTSGKATTNSVATVPVFGNNPGNPNEPCYQSSFASAYCSQGWQWMLDYVVDVHGNTMSLWYTQEGNNYARNNTDSLVSSYTRAEDLQRIDYGTDNRSGTDTEYTATLPPMRVNFGVADRCVPGTTCDTAHPANWPDTPWDQSCTSSSSCPGLWSPTFWTQKRLDTVTTKVAASGQTCNSDAGYQCVEQWTLHQTYTDPGDATRAGLWLSSLSHQGLVGTTTPVPDVSFTGAQMANRVNTADPNAPPMKWWRIQDITTESGGIIDVKYTAPECVTGSHMPASADSNTMRCFPAYWTRPLGTQPTIDWFNKYVVTQVTESDTNTAGGNIRVITQYAYPNPPAWHYTSDNGTVATSQETWDQWRGYDQVNTTVGDPGEQTFSTTRYFRGMNGDHLSSGTRSVSVDGIPDEDVYAGMARETITDNGPGGAEVSESTYTPWESTPTATRTINGITTTARHAGTAVVKTRTDLDGSRQPRTTTTTATFDDTYGYLTKVANGGDDATTADDVCTTTTRLNNTTAWIIGVASETVVYGLPCGQNPATDQDVISDTRSYYDNQPLGTAPTRGDVTQTDTAKAWSTSSISWLTTTKDGYDAYGRLTDTWDVRGNHSNIAITPASGGPVTHTTTTNSQGWVTSADLQPAWGTTLASTDVNGQRTESTFDGLGRVTAQWAPNRLRSSGQSATVTYSYSISNTGVSSVTVSGLNAAGNYVSSYELYDALLRPRQTQTPSATGSGAVIADTVYDSAGRVAKTNSYPIANAAGTSLYPAAGQIINDVSVPTQTVTRYDGVGRATADIFYSYQVEQWRTTTAYGGDHTDVTPPAGGTPTSTTIDARGRTTSLATFDNTTPTGTPYTTTSYIYNRKNQLATIADTVGHQWTYTYDFQGRVNQQTDPDTGNTASNPSATFTYNDAGDLLTSTDSQSQTLAYAYDSVGRVTGEYLGSTTGTQLTGYTYDTTLMTDGVTQAKGQPASSTRYIGGNAYTTTALRYDPLYHTTAARVTIPSVEGSLAGSYTFTASYNPDGSINSFKIPAAGGLTAETLIYGYDTTTGMPTTLAADTNSDGLADITYVIGTQYTQYGEPSQTLLQTAGGPIAGQNLSYDVPTHRLAELHDNQSVAPGQLLDTHYSYNPAGNLTKAADTPPGGSSDTQCYTYDTQQRLNQAWTPASGDCTAQPTNASLGGPAPYWQSWTFDNTSNRTQQVNHNTANGDATTTYTHPTGSNPQPHTLTGTSTTDNTGTHTATYSYDAAGNTASRPGPHGQQTLTWDTEGHLSQLTDSAGTSSYIYSPSGSRLITHDPTGTTLDIGPLQLRLTGTTVTATHFYQLDGQTIGQRTASGVTWLFPDQQNTTLIAVNAATGARTQRRQTPYGAPRGSTPTWVNNKGYLGGTQDPTGLTHLGAREYDPSTGTFASADPVFEANDPNQQGGYTYAGNDPTTRTDANGQRATWIPDGLSTDMCEGDWACQVAYHGPQTDPCDANPTLCKTTIHDVLGIVELVPVLGSIAMAVDAQIYYNEGNQAAGDALTEAAAIDAMTLEGGIPAKYASMDVIDKQVEEKAVAQLAKKKALEDAAAQAEREAAAAQDEAVQITKKARSETPAGISDPTTPGVSSDGSVSGGRGSAPSSSRSVTDKLQAHVDKAVADYNSGVIKVSPAQKAISSFIPSLGEAFRGQVIDKAVKTAVPGDKTLPSLYITRSGEFGPDFLDLDTVPGTPEWWDITTPGQWAQHLSDYAGFGNGTPLFTR